MATTWKMKILWCCLLTVALTESRPVRITFVVEEGRGSDSGGSRHDPWIDAELRRMKAENSTTTLTSGSESSEKDSTSVNEGKNVTDSIDHMPAANASVPSPTILESPQSASAPEASPQSRSVESLAESSPLDETPDVSSSPSVAPRHEEPTASPQPTPSPPASAPSSSSLAPSAYPSSSSPSVSPIEAPPVATFNVPGTPEPDAAPVAQPTPTFTDDAPSDTRDASEEDASDSDVPTDEEETPSSSRVPSNRELEPEEPAVAEVHSQNTKTTSDVETSSGSRSGLPAAVVALLIIFSVAIIGGVGFYAFRFWKRHTMRRYRGWRPYDFELIEL